ncbi:MAG: hypothetical protein J5645_03195 [Lachnospiraceae bacterium]|nr:hypothetical protein [Lachnospiraceae bacterium]
MTVHGLTPISGNIIWDIEDLSKQPPWGNEISKETTDLLKHGLQDMFLAGRHD